MSTIKHVDKIIVMHKGSIREMGTHQELLDQNINIEQINSDVLKDKNDVMFYFTGLKQVEEIENNRRIHRTNKREVRSQKLL